MATYLGHLVRQNAVRIPGVGITHAEFHSMCIDFQHRYAESIRDLNLLPTFATCE
jgi:hypothetical protein